MNDPFWSLFSIIPVIFSRLNSGTGEINMTAIANNLRIAFSSKTRMNQSNPYRTMDQIYRDWGVDNNSYDSSNNIDSMTKLDLVTRMSNNSDCHLRYEIIFGNGKKSTIRFDEPITESVFVPLDRDLKYGNKTHKVGHMLFGDSGLLVDPYYDSHVTFYDEIISADLL